MYSKHICEDEDKLHSRLHFLTLHLATNRNEAAIIICTVVIRDAEVFFCSVTVTGLHEKCKVFYDKNTTPLCYRHVKCITLRHDGRKVTVEQQSYFQYKLFQNIYI